MMKPENKPLKHISIISIADIYKCFILFNNRYFDFDEFMLICY